MNTSPDVPPHCHLNPSAHPDPLSLGAFAAHLRGASLGPTHPFNVPALSARLGALGVVLGGKMRPALATRILAECTGCDVRRDRLPALPPPPPSPASPSDSDPSIDTGRDQKAEEQKKEGWKSKGTLAMLKKLERELVALRWVYGLDPPTASGGGSGGMRGSGGGSGSGGVRGRGSGGVKGGEGGRRGGALGGLEETALARQWRRAQCEMPLLAAYVRERAKAVKMVRQLGPEGEGGEVMLGGGWDCGGWWERATGDPWMATATATATAPVEMIAA